MKTIILSLLVIFILGCDKEVIELPEEEIIEIVEEAPFIEETFNYKCQETHSFNFFRPAFFELSGVDTLPSYTIYDVTPSYILNLINDFYIDTIVYMKDVYYFDFNLGIYRHKIITDGDSIGRKVHFLHCVKIK